MGAMRDIHPYGLCQRVHLRLNPWNLFDAECRQLHRWSQNQFSTVCNSSGLHRVVDGVQNASHYRNLTKFLPLHRLRCPPQPPMRRTVQQVHVRGCGEGHTKLSSASVSAGNSKNMLSSPPSSSMDALIVEPPNYVPRSLVRQGWQRIANIDIPQSFSQPLVDAP